MCGILAIASPARKLEKNEVEKMLAVLSHRGKDNQTVVLRHDGKIGMGHVRLSLIDLSEQANQPMCNENETIWLTFNGEIYNFIELRNELIQLGHIFKSRSDAEVIIHGYEQWGTDVLQRLNGMFAFVIYDEKTHRMFIARDRIGIKPLYFSFFKQNLMVASEIKSILQHPEFIKEINETSLCEYFTYRYVPSPNTIFKNISKLPPAFYLMVDTHTLEYREHEYWTLSLDDKPFNDNLEEEVHKKLNASVVMHLQSDVPVGIFLSSGIDSSTIAYLTQKNKYNPQAFTIGFETWDKSEHIRAREIATQLEIEYKEKILTAESIKNIYESVYHYDEPIADISIVPTFEISRFASSQVRTVLSGEGGDELFAGYGWHKKWMRQQLLNQIGIGLNNNYLVNYYAQSMAMGMFDENELKELLPNDKWEFIPEDVFHFYRKHYKKGVDPLKALQYLDLKTFLAELVLTKVDRASMAHTLEVRVPFLNHELVEFMFLLPRKQVFKKGEQKYLLQNVLKSKIEASILQQPKQGFVGPDKFYEQKLFYSEKLKKSKLAQNGYLKQTTINKYLQMNDFWRLWKILILENWFNYWILDEKS
ncbi:MAG TPA: asparagine synthase (glutamine-hydrolyzing) [Bacteroidales bacterium]|jgi:asparagine synthase (glutamine-hydrolysing)|nr:asparagine synthase (glutamine-hydrolyzing) [Bacteroidales bacterium]